MNIKANPSNAQPTVNELRKHRKELLAKIDAIKADFKRGLDKDAGERAVELENAEVLNEILQVSENQVAEINEKLLALGAH